MRSAELKRKILLLDDNPNVRSFVVQALKAEGYEVCEAEDGHTALYLAQNMSFDLIILDIMLVDSDYGGLDVCKDMRQSGIDTPVIFLTVMDRANDPYFFRRAFELNADDYIAKREELLGLERDMRIPPAEVVPKKGDTEELLTRVRARIRRSGQRQPETVWLDVGPHLRIDLDSLQVEVFSEDRYQDAGLTRTEKVIFLALARQPGRTIGRWHLIEAVEDDRRAGGRQGTMTARALENHVSNLRSKLGTSAEPPAVIEAVSGLGYRLDVP